MRVHIVNPSHFSYGTGFITPRWMFVLAAATPAKWGDPILSDESLEQFDTDRLEKGDVIGIGLHTGNALVGYQLAEQIVAARIGQVTMQVSAGGRYGKLVGVAASSDQLSLF